MPCICGRPYPTKLRDLFWVLFLMVTLSVVVRAERERREYLAARKELIQLGAVVQAFVDSVHATARRAP